MSASGPRGRRGARGGSKRTETLKECAVLFLERLPLYLQPHLVFKKFQLILFNVCLLRQHQCVVCITCVHHVHHVGIAGFFLA